MDDILVDESGPALAVAVRRNLYALFERFALGSYAATQRGDGWYAWRTGVPYPWFNGVLVRTPFAEVGEPGVEEALALFAGYPHAITWWLDPGVPVGSWRAALASLGLDHEDGTPGMAVALETCTANAPAVDGMEIVPVTSGQDLETWTTVFVPGYGLPGDWWESVHGMISGLGCDLPFRNYLGLLDGEPVATSTLFLGAGVAGVYNVSTLPHARGRGIGAAMTAAALLDGRSLGYRVGVLQSSPLGYSVYQRLGFTEVCRLEHFTGPAPRPPRV